MCKICQTARTYQTSSRHVIVCSHGLACPFAAPVSLMTRPDMQQFFDVLWSTHKWGRQLEGFRYTRRHLLSRPAVPASGNIVVSSAVWGTRELGKCVGIRIIENSKKARTRDMGKQRNNDMIHGTKKQWYDSWHMAFQAITRRRGKLKDIYVDFVEWKATEEFWGKTCNGPVLPSELFELHLPAIFWVRACGKVSCTSYDQWCGHVRALGAFRLMLQASFVFFRVLCRNSSQIATLTWLGFQRWICEFLTGKVWRSNEKSGKRDVEIYHQGQQRFQRWAMALSLQLCQGTWRVRSI